MRKGCGAGHVNDSHSFNFYLQLPMAPSGHCKEEASSNLHLAGALRVPCSPSRLGEGIAEEGHLILCTPDTWGQGGVREDTIHHASFSDWSRRLRAQQESVDEEDEELTSNDSLLCVGPCAGCSDVYSLTYTYIIPTLQRRKLRLREVRQLGHP